MTQLNHCNKPINDVFRYANKYTHPLDYGSWTIIKTSHPHPKLPTTMLDSMDFSGVELYSHIKNTLKKYKVSGKMLEVGARGEEGFIESQNFWEMEYYNLNLENPHNCPRTILADITNCPEIPDNTYDYIYSMDTFEHIKEPWKASKEIIRILKPGGIVFVVTLFSWRYHPQPVDFWRFTPHCLAFLFEPLELIEANWDIRNRRVPYQGHEIDKDVCPEDQFGPWLENWRVFYIGVKK